MIEFNEERHEYKHEGRVVPGVTSVLADIGLANYDYVDAETMEAAAKFGKAVHRVTELHDHNDLILKGLDPILKKYLNQWKKFLKDSGAKIIEIERRVFCKVYFYCGTLDRVIEIDGKYYVLDIKTGCKMKSHALQNAAYKYAYFNESINGEISRRLGKTTYTLYLKEDSYKLEPHKDKNDINFFLSALQIYNFKRRK